MLYCTGTVQAQDSTCMCAEGICVSKNLMYFMQNFTLKILYWIEKSYKEHVSDDNDDNETFW